MLVHRIIDSLALHPGFLSLAEELRVLDALHRQVLTEIDIRPVAFTYLTVNPLDVGIPRVIGDKVFLCLDRKSVV